MLEELTIYDVRALLVKFLLKNSTIPETLSRTISRLKSEKLIAEEDVAFILLNLPRLRSLL
jgi:hypothetical protein